jgi:hypothetical protein
VDADTVLQQWEDGGCGGTDSIHSTEPSSFESRSLVTVLAIRVGDPSRRSESARDRTLSLAEAVCRAGGHDPRPFQITNHCNCKGQAVSGQRITARTASA